MNILSQKDVTCTQTLASDGDHKLKLSDISHSDLEPEVIQKILIALLREAKKQSGAVVPDREKTIVSCKGVVYGIVWEPFTGGVFDRARPKSALDATLYRCLLSMKHSTIYRRTRISRSTEEPLVSQSSFSRQDIASSYEALAGESLRDIIQGIRRIRIQNFLVEETEFDNAEEKRLRKEKQRNAKRKRTNNDGAAGEDQQKKRTKRKKTDG
ncbi:hypothetical protein COCVIDRAFT_21370 [Bipolaris victoriae FI3]|uniref:Uncharacterized protein n=1 Tax=Bipolaris victoriae (strain FI3) TaxID=930091 RepID=W7DQD0_BIPV3|nr:hypothetical protein COCVIDRAFT_21370 [Bipolaris victoriae FI3]